VLNIPQKAGQKPDTEPQEYSIIGKSLQDDPWEAEPEYKEQVAYVPKAWSSVPMAVWVPNINWVVFAMVLAIQIGVTVAIFFTSVRAPDGPPASCMGFCGSWIHLDAKAHTHTGLALFLLIAFRANSSYDRYWEGRKLWGLLINRTRDLARQIVHYVRDEPAAHRRMLGFIVAFAVAKKRHLRDEKGMQELESVLSIQDVRNIQEAEHMPLYCIDVLTNYIQEAYAAGKISDHVLQMMDANLTTYQDTLGGCERIKKTPIPVAFVVHMRAFMILWLVTLPTTLAVEMGWTTIAVCFVVAFAILGIDAMAVEIENPFGHDFNDLPLGMICETIAKNVREILDRSQHSDKKLAYAGRPCRW
jgi:putative membrane protein